LHALSFDAIDGTIPRTIAIGFLAHHQVTDLKNPVTEGAFSHVRSLTSPIYTQLFKEFQLKAVIFARNTCLQKPRTRFHELGEKRVHLHPSEFSREKMKKH